MARINLLPWREQYREEKKKEFLTILGLVAAASAVVAFLWISFVNGQIDNQRSRNTLLQTELRKLEERVKEIEALREKRKAMIARMEVIQNLQGKRPAIVHVFDQFVQALPDGVYVTSLKRTGSRIALEGVAESNQRVSSFMRNLDKSEWFTGPNLTKVVSGGDLGEQSSRFTMTVKIIDPQEQKDEEEGAV